MTRIGQALYDHWDVVAMCLSMSVLFLFEMLGVFTDKYVTITAIVRTYVPWWLRLLIWLWLGWHFKAQKGETWRALGW